MSETVRRLTFRAACLGWLPILCAGFPSVSAAESGAHQWLVGGAYFSPRDRSDPLYTELEDSAPGRLLGIDERFTSPGTAARVSDATTLLLIYAHHFSDHLAVKLEGGVPAVFELRGEGQVRPTGAAGALLEVDLGAPANNPLATARLWAPTVLLQYSFRDATRRFRPSIALGATYTWYSDIELDEDFCAALNQQFGQPLALATGHPGPTTVHADAQGGVGTIANVGFEWRLAGPWSLVGSLSFLRLATTSIIEIHAEDGTQLVRSRAHIDVDPVIGALLLGYRF